MENFMPTTKGTHAIVWILFSLFYLHTTFAQAQFDSTASQLVTDPVYFGYEIAAGVKTQSLESNLSQINGLHIAAFGAKAGIKLANTRAALRATAGLYYSSASLPYSFDFLEGSLSGQLYMLRLKEDISYHAVEPYLVASVTYSSVSYFGTYLDSEPRNYSTASETLLGKVGYTQGAAGIGAEFQMENDKNQYIHFFAEVLVGTTLFQHASTATFSESNMICPASFTLGMSFGKFRNKSQAK